MRRTAHAFARTRKIAARAAPRTHAESAGVFSTQLLEFDGQQVNVGRRCGNGTRPPLLLFNGIGANIDLLAPLAAMKNGATPAELVVDIHDQPVERTTAVMALINQHIITRELEQINSALCVPCQCTLCCEGPAREMHQDFFEIPLVQDEWHQFPVKQIYNADSQAKLADDEVPLPVAGSPFYTCSQLRLIHWRRGWSLILPRESRCPNLEASGRCMVYPKRPQVCRRPQIFPYIVEPVARQGQAVFRLRQSLLGVMDCPYVQALQDDIAAYAAACELEIVFRHNKD